MIISHYLQLVCDPRLKAKTVLDYHLIIITSENDWARARLINCHEMLELSLASIPGGILMVLRAIESEDNFCDAKALQ